MNALFKRLYAVGGESLAAKMLTLHDQRCRNALDKLFEAMRKREHATAENYLEYLKVYFEEVGADDDLLPILKAVTWLNNQRKHQQALDRLKELEQAVRKHHEQLSADLDKLASA